MKIVKISELTDKQKEEVNQRIGNQIQTRANIRNNNVDLIEEFIKKQQEQNRLEQENRKANFENFLSTKTTAMNEVSNQIQEQNEKKRQQEQQFKDYLSELSKANKKPQTVQPTENNQYQGNRSVSDEILFPTNTEIRIS